MAERLEERFFFVYDNLVLQDQDDDLADSVLYFDPKFTSIHDRCTLVGHVIGVLDCLHTFAGSPVTTFQLSDRSLVVKHVDHYVLGMSGDLKTPVALLHRLLDSLYDMFRFFHGSILHFRQACECDGRNFRTSLGEAWDCYLPFLHRYGDAVLSRFQNLLILNPTAIIVDELDLPGICHRLLGDVAKRVPGCIAGCMFHKNCLLVTELNTALTLRLSIIRPKQQHLSCVPNDSDAELPEGVRLLRVFLTAEEFRTLPLSWRQRLMPLCDNLSKAGQTASGIDRHAIDSVAESADAVSSACSELTSLATASACKPRDRKSVGISDPIVFESPVLPFSSSSSCENTKSTGKNHRLLLSPSPSGLNVDLASSGKSCSWENSAGCVSRSCEDNSLVPLELYVQGNSHSTFLLLCEQDSIQGFTIVSELWKQVLTSLSEIECLLLQHSFDGSENKSKRVCDELLPECMSYLVYDCTAAKLTGNTVSPVTSEDYEFCNMALGLREEFDVLPEMVSKSASSHGGHAQGAVRHGDKVLFYQLPPAHGSSSLRLEARSPGLAVIDQLLSSSRC